MSLLVYIGLDSNVQELIELYRAAHELDASEVSVTAYYRGMRLRAAETVVLIPRFGNNDMIKMRLASI